MIDLLVTMLSRIILSYFMAVGVTFTFWRFKADTVRIEPQFTVSVIVLTGVLSALLTLVSHE